MAILVGSALLVPTAAYATSSNNNQNNEKDDNHENEAKSKDRKDKDDDNHKGNNLGNLISHENDCDDGKNKKNPQADKYCKIRDLQKDIKEDTKDLASDTETITKIT